MPISSLSQKKVKVLLQRYWFPYFLSSLSSLFFMSYKIFSHYFKKCRPTGESKRCEISRENFFPKILNPVGTDFTVFSSPHQLSLRPGGCECSILFPGLWPDARWGTCTKNAVYLLYNQFIVKNDVFFGRPVKSARCTNICKDFIKNIPIENLHRGNSFI